VTNIQTNLQVDGWDTYPPTVLTPPLFKKPCSYSIF